MTLANNLKQVNAPYDAVITEKRHHWIQVVSSWFSPKGSLLDSMFTSRAYLWTMGRADGAFPIVTIEYSPSL